MWQCSTATEATNKHCAVENVVVIVHSLGPQGLSSQSVIHQERMYGEQTVDLVSC